MNGADRAFGGGFDTLTGAGTGAPEGPSPEPPSGIRTVAPDAPTATTIVLVRHGEAVCNVSGVCGGPIGCQGLTDRGRAQVVVLRDRLTETGELAGAGALYASVLPRAVETAELLAPALAGVDVDGVMGEPPDVVEECGLCELHPGEADGLDWAEFSDRYGNPDWDTDPGRPIAPGGESWTGFVNRVADNLDGVAGRHPGELVVVVCHAGVVEASLLAKTPVVDGLAGARMQLRTQHASLTTWEVDGGRWKLIGYNDGAHHLGSEGIGGDTRSPTTSGRAWMGIGAGERIG
ncbi:MAG: histidine phosphatase family protein [Acidimicrobiales bacterium]